MPTVIFDSWHSSLRGKNIMKRINWIILGVILAFVIYINIPDDSELKNVLYGERPAFLQSSKITSRWHIDKLGHVYPDEILPDSSLLKSQASIKAYYKNNPTVFATIASKYNLISTVFSNDNFNDFQDSLIAQKATKINAQLSNFSNLFILIHGFRKPIVSQHNTTSSFVDNLLIQSTIEAQIPGKNYFIELYWDGMYDYFEVQKRNQHRETFALFENEARTNAVFAGYGMRKLIAQIDKNKLTIISHSLGARVAVSCLFNTYDEVVDQTFQSYPTPVQDSIQICLLAPAIGSKPFEEYYERSTTFDYSQKDNYQLNILYNEEDLVLLKKSGFFGPGPKEFGDTRLGCNYEETATILKVNFVEKYPNSNISLFNANVGPTHLVEHYAHSKAFRDFLSRSKQ